MLHSAAVLNEIVLEKKEEIVLGTESGIFSVSFYGSCGYGRREWGCKKKSKGKLRREP